MKHCPAEYFKAKQEVRVLMRVALAEAQNWHCCWCGIECITEPEKHNSVTIEHVTPKSLGGSDSWENLAMACNRCNRLRETYAVEHFLVIASRSDYRQLSRNKIRNLKV